MDTGALGRMILVLGIVPVVAGALLGVISCST
jgi:hypothetical protein